MTHWPAWLLVIAWGCANLSPSAACVVLAWLAETRNFSHQQRLTEATAYLLAGQKPPSLLAKFKRDLPKPIAPTLPVEVAAKEIKLACTETFLALPAPASIERPFSPAGQTHGRTRAAPPHEPPRLA